MQSIVINLVVSWSFRSLFRAVAPLGSPLAALYLFGLLDSCEPSLRVVSLDPPREPAFRSSLSFGSLLGSRLSPGSPLLVLAKSTSH
jgi:hypothetical protein